MASVASLQQAVSAVARELAVSEAGEAAHAETPDAQVAAAAALDEAKRRQLAAAQRALHEREDEALKQLVLAPLFTELASLVFALLPVDSRLRCREVCRGWRAFLADVRFWQVCDLSAASGVARRSPALLRAASERALGTLRELDVSGWYHMTVGEGVETLADEQLLPVLRENAASLLELRARGAVGITSTNSTAAAIEQLLTAAPRLRLLECDAHLQGEEARGPLPRLLREPHFAPLLLQNFTINAIGAQPPPNGPAFAAWAASQPSLKGLFIYGVQLDSPALDAMVGLATSQLRNLTLGNCRLSPASLPALTQMLECRSLKTIIISNAFAPLLVGTALPAFCTALRASRLGALYLDRMRMWESQADGLAVIAACTGHPTLRQIHFEKNDLNVTGRATIGAALDALQASIPGLFFNKLRSG